MRNSPTGGEWTFLLMAALVTYFWWPALWSDKVLLHGDAGHHGLPQVWLLSRALAGQDALLWASRIYGGHPFFAEAQGGFANPLNILSAWLFDPIYAVGIERWASMLLGGSGVLCLCRLLGISRCSATFASIAVIFSGYWIGNQHNQPIYSCLAWLPWLLVAMEYWFRQPGLSTAAFLAISAALLVFGGYPHLAYATTLYGVTTLVGPFFAGDARARIVAQWRGFLFSGLLAVLLAIGLSAIQFLPLMELVGQSHRSQGVPLPYDGMAPPLFFLRGLLYFHLGTDETGENAFNLASLPVFSLICVLPLFRIPPRICGHLLGALLLFNMGMSSTSPLFYVLYKYHLLPGLHYFRSMLPFFALAVVGFSVVAAHVLDALSSELQSDLRSIFRKNHRLLWLAGGACATGFGYLAYYCFTLAYSMWCFFAPVLLLMVYALLVRFDKRRWFPLLAVLILATDVATLRISALAFFDRQILDKPEVVRAIGAEPDVQEYRTMDMSVRSAAMVFLGPVDPLVGSTYRRLLSAMSPFPVALQWQIPSINGVLALPLSRRMLLDPVLLTETIGTETNRPGLRLIDILGVRYISVDGLFPTPGLHLHWQDKSQSLFIMKNDYAKPRFQIYWNAKVVNTPEQALAGLKAAQSEKVFIEKHRGEHLTLPAECATCAETKPTIEVIEAQAMRYRVNVNMPREGWLFLADANYPGWEATVNGKAQPVYSAQVLGKAVRLQAGRNQVTIRYVPRMFYIGAVLSGLTLVLVLLILFWHPVRRYLGRNMEKA